METVSRREEVVIYVASSWKNEYLDGVFEALEQWGVEYYDFRADSGFHWSEVQPGYDEMALTPGQFLAMLNHPRSKEGFQRDLIAMENSKGCILVLPCNRAAHIEAGWFIGRGKPTAIYLRERPVRPELMYKLADLVTGDIDELMQWVWEYEA